MATTQSTACEQIAELRRLVAIGCRVLGDNGQNDWVWGHLSARDPDGRGAWMKASGYSFDEMTEERIILVDRDGAVLEGEEPRHSEYPIHTEVLAARPDLGAVVHSHAEHCVSFAATDQKLRGISHAATWFVPPQVPRFEKTSDLILTPELGRDVAEALGDHYALFLVNHGIVTAGPDVQTAVMRALLLEQACRAQLLAQCYGGWATWTGDEEALVKRTHIAAPHHIHSAFEYLVRKLDARL